ncbi:hypothetical protein [Streptomyces sp. NBC_00073]|uniref:hypothetical protein n=1 Tax=Streptomyces sp. NBC_00073 TaxID=2975640 RepID=UPI002F913056
MISAALTVHLRFPDPPPPPARDQTDLGLRREFTAALRARAWITDAIATADRINRAGAADPLEGLAEKW